MEAACRPGTVFIFLLQLRELVFGHPQVFLFTIASALVWVAWVIKVVLSRRYKPFSQPYDVGASVIIPVVDEPIDLFHQVLSLIVEQEPAEVIVVINGRRNEALEAVCSEFPTITCLWTPIAGKRNAVKVGVEASTQPVTVLVDSDTIWTTYTDGKGVVRRTLPELVKPFVDPTVGGVTTRQRILEPERSFLTRWADWLENTRALYSMPAQSHLGQVGCLPGRTIAFRREILIRCMTDFMSERFLGIFLEVSDDRTLTNYTLKQGYRTVYQFDSLVYTDAPLKLKKLFKQQLRWARGSQYNTLRMLPWMMSQAPTLAFFFLLDIALPFLLVGASLGWLYRAHTETGVNFYKPMLQHYPGWHGYALVAVLILSSSWASSLVRQARHLAYKPGDALRMPLFILASTFFLQPVRIIGFARMAHVAAWGTRAGAYTAHDAAPEGALTIGGRQSPARSDMTRVEAGARVGIAEAPALTEVDALEALMLTGADTETRQTRRQSRLKERPQNSHRLNVLAVLPYIIVAAIFAVEALAYV